MCRAIRFWVNMSIDIEPCLSHMCDLRRVFADVEITADER
jgi:hypothetical protein